MARRPWLPDLRELWRFRGLFYRFTVRDLTLRYRQTALGVIWVVVQPLIAAGAFTLVFGRIAKLPANGLPYIVFSLAGLLCWNLFSSIFTKSSGSLITGSALVSKVYFPRALLPLSTVGSALVDFLVGLALFATFMIGYGLHPGLAVLTFPVWVLVTAIMAIGLGLAASTLSVRYRDVAYLIPVLFQFLLYASPVAYSLNAIPQRDRIYFEINPLTGVLEAFRWSLLGRSQLPGGLVVYSAAFAVGSLLVGSLAFTRYERRFADVI